MADSREKKMTISLSDLEEAVRDEVALYLGTDGAGVIRQGLLDLGRKCGITIDNVMALKKRKAPKH